MDNLILLDWGAFTLFLLIVMRMFGFIALSPIFSREGIPSFTRGGFALILAVIVFLMEDTRLAVPNTNLELMVLMIRELLVGMIFSLVMNFFFAITSVGGNVLDMQIGFSMAQSYDPASGATVTVSTHLLNTLMFLIFFAANGHHTLLRLMMTSSQLVPYGNIFLGDIMYQLVIQLFAECMLLGIKLAMPILAAELLGQVGMGVLMKTIPQINIFSINIDLKVLIGLSLMILFMPSMADFMLDMEIYMLDNLQRLLISMSQKEF